MQLRKSVSLRGNHPVEFEKGTQKVDRRLVKIMKNQARVKLVQNKVAKSYKDMLKALKETKVLPKNTILVVMIVQKNQT